MQENSQNGISGLLHYDPMVLLRDILRRWYLIVAVVLIVGVSARIGAELSYRPEYTTHTTFVVSGRNGTDSVYQNLNRTSELAGVFTQVLNSSILRDKILEELGMKSFEGSISASAMEGTNLLTMQVTASNPRTAFLVSRSIIENHTLVTESVLGDVALDVLQSPRVPVAPSNSMDSLHKAKLVALGAGAAVFLLLGYLSYLRDTVRSRQEVSEKLDCHCLGEVRHERKYKTLRTILRRKKTSVLITRPDASFRFVESIQKIRRKVEHRMGKDKKVILVTSVLEDEGKSTISANLALSFALVGKKALLIDCDLRKPACHKILQHRAFAHSTSQVIRGEISLADALETDPVSGLSLLLESKPVSGATDLLSGSGFVSMLAQARKQFDVVILDMPPMSIAPDAEAAAGKADGGVMVVRQNAAAAARINQSLASLKNADLSVFGCVLNNMMAVGLLHTGHYGYGYGHYGKYGKYGHYGHYGAYGAPSGEDPDNGASGK